VTYRFARERLDYSDYATGRLLSGLPGRPAFPVRLADEVFQRCLAYSARHGTAKRLTLYDPCCGGAYLLTVLALLHWQKLEMIVGSDADGDVLPLASRNLSLLTVEGLRERIDKIETMHRLYGKESHATALESAKRLETRIRTLHGMHGVPTHLFQADALNSGDLRANLDRGVVDLVITDVPYGKRSAWIGTTSRDVQTRDPLWCLLESLSAVLARHAVIAVISDKSQRVVHERYARIDRFQVGTRRVEVLTC
jgi:23S rRNA (guanine2535-N1)-methyltransferase